MRWVVFTSTTEPPLIMGPLPEEWDLDRLPLPSGFHGMEWFTSWTAAYLYQMEEQNPELRQTSEGGAA
jgi:hypothetical protein